MTHSYLVDRKELKKKKSRFNSNSLFIVGIHKTENYNKNLYRVQK